jgi:hypothetical protein
VGVLEHRRIRRMGNMLSWFESSVRMPNIISLRPASVEAARFIGERVLTTEKDPVAAGCGVAVRLMARIDHVTACHADVEVVPYYKLPTDKQAIPIPQSPTERVFDGGSETTIAVPIHPEMSARLVFDHALYGASLEAHRSPKIPELLRTRLETAKDNPVRAAGTALSSSLKIVAGLVDAYKQFEAANDIQSVAGARTDYYGVRAHVPLFGVTDIPGAAELR